MYSRYTSTLIHPPSLSIPSPPSPPPLSLFLFRSQLISLQCYTHDCLSCLVHCSSDKELSEEDDKQLALWAVAQVPMDTSPLEWEGLMSHDDIMSVSLDDQVLDRSVNIITLYQLIPSQGYRLPEFLRGILSMF